MYIPRHTPIASLPDVHQAMQQISTQTHTARGTYPPTVLPAACFWKADTAVTTGYIYNGRRITFTALGVYRACQSSWLPDEEPSFLLAFDYWREEDRRAVSTLYRDAGGEPSIDSSNCIICPVQATGRIPLYERSKVTNDTRLFDCPLEPEHLHDDDILLMEFRIEKPRDQPCPIKT
ncbi:hypothetical protein EIP86_003477, partial [Pleurotus ostreatoroseus]